MSWVLYNLHCSACVKIFVACPLLIIITNHTHQFKVTTPVWSSPWCVIMDPLRYTDNLCTVLIRLSTSHNLSFVPRPSNVFQCMREKLEIIYKAWSIWWCNNNVSVTALLHAIHQPWKMDMTYMLYMTCFFFFFFFFLTFFCKAFDSVPHEPLMAKKFTMMNILPDELTTIYIPC